MFERPIHDPNRSAPEPSDASISPQFDDHALRSNLLRGTSTRSYLYTREGLIYNDPDLPGEIIIPYSLQHDETDEVVIKSVSYRHGVDVYSVEFDQELAKLIVQQYRTQIVTPFRELATSIRQTDFAVFALVDWSFLSAAENSDEPDVFETVIGDYDRNGKRVDVLDIYCHLYLPKGELEEVRFDIFAGIDPELQYSFSDARTIDLYSTLKRKHSLEHFKDQVLGAKGEMILVRLADGRIVPDFLPDKAQSSLLGNDPAC